MKISHEAFNDLLEWLSERHDENGLITVAGRALALQLAILTGIPFETIYSKLITQATHDKP